MNEFFDKTENPEFSNILVIKMGFLMSKVSRKILNENLFWKSFKEPTSEGSLANLKFRQTWMNFPMKIIHSHAQQSKYLAISSVFASFALFLILLIHAKNV